MPARLEITIKPNVRDVVAEQLRVRVKDELGLNLQFAHFVECYNIDAELSEQEIETLKKSFTDSIIQECHHNNPANVDMWRIEIGLLPGVTDNVGKTAQEAVRDALGREVFVYYSRMYSISSISEDACIKIAGLLHNPLIEKYFVHVPLKPANIYLPKVALEHEPRVEKISLSISKAKLELLAKDRLLALSVDEMEVVREYLRDERVLKQRKDVGLDNKITDVELEAIAQTWSEHCKHKIFNAKIKYDDGNEAHAINSIFKTFIVGATDAINKPYIVSVFRDNGGIIKFDHNFDVAIKVETHNAPSALDPYGGALTGVLGVQRDVLGTGLGAEPIANLDVLCFGYLNEKEIPKGVLHPKRIYEGVIRGIQDGGNKMGIPTVNGSITFEREFVARPLVYCGTVGIMPSRIGDRRTNEKIIKPGYLAIMVGGRIGKDGIHGATFSSQQISEGVPQSVVQIGDPITQKKMLDFILEARDARLYEAITDNGAGGLSSSIGELARFSNGCKIYLERCPLKYAGLDPWEILISESQERMTLAITPEKLEELKKLAKKNDVELSVVGEFTHSSKFHVLFRDVAVAYLDMKFLHEGLPQMKLSAAWNRKIFPEPNISETNLGEVLKKLLSLPNIASKENVIRRYDHEVKAMTVVKPIMRGPNDAAVIKPLSNSSEGLVIAHGICPKIVHDAYDMAALALDEAVRNALAVGAKYGYLAALDNFCWPDPVVSERNLDGEYKLAQLVRACISLYDYTTAYGIPLISGKDSMKNDYHIVDRKYSILPTLLVTVVGKMDNVQKALTSDFKQPGDYIYVLGKTRDEMGGSEYFKLFGGVGNKNPVVRKDETIPLYHSLSHAIEEGLIASCHDVSDGGIAVALVECAFGAGYGADLDISLLPSDSEREDVLLFSESAGRFIVTVKVENAEKFEKAFAGNAFAKVGRVRGDKRYVIRRVEEFIINEDIYNLKQSWEGKVS